MELAKKLTKEPFYQQAYDALKDDIISGRLKPGEKLTDQGLAERLGISRTPIREAVRQLVKEGLLVGKPNRGVTVFSPSPQDVAEIYALRAALEGLAASLAALNNRRVQYIIQMEEVVEEAKGLAQTHDSTGVARKNTQFHDLILAASESDTLIKLLDPLRNKAILCRLSSMQYPTNLNISIKEHETIIDHLKKGDSLQSGRLVQQHILQAGRRLLEQLQEGGLAGDYPILRLYQIRQAQGGNS